MIAETCVDTAEYVIIRGDVAGFAGAVIFWCCIIMIAIAWQDRNGPTLKIKRNQKDWEDK